MAGYVHKVEEVKTDTRKMVHACVCVRVSIKSNFSSVNHIPFFGPKAKEEKKTQPIANAGHSRSIKTP